MYASVTTTVLLFTYVQNCPGLSTSTLMEEPISGLLNTDTTVLHLRINNKVIMFDGMKLDGNTDNSWNGSTVLVTGSYNSQDSAQVWSTSPYGARIYSHNAEWISTAVDDNGDAEGIKIGYNGWNDVVPDIQNTTISGLASIVTTFGYKSMVVQLRWEATSSIQNNTLTHFRSTGAQQSTSNQDMCPNAGGANTTIATTP